MPGVESAAADNAAWCDLVCRHHGLDTAWTDALWSAGARSPEGYPDAVTLRPGVAPDAVLARVQDGPGCSVKDSFADVDLAPAGFSVLFEATWVHHPAGSPGPRQLDWSSVETGPALLRWAEDEDVEPFPTSLLNEPDVALFHAPADGAGFVLTRTGPVVGVCYAWAGRADPGRLWADVVATAARRHPGHDLVGYERGDDLTACLAAGFSATGPLRIWMR